MKSRFYCTSEIARAVGVHPNTVRLYEQLGFLPPARRGPTGYRQFTEFHLAQMCLARLALHGGWPGRSIRRSALALVKLAARGDLAGAYAQAQKHLLLVRAERVHAEAAVQALERWSQAPEPAARVGGMQIKDAAALLDVTVDILRNWEKNGLIRVPRAPGNGYRSFGPEEIDRLRVIRLLFRAGYGASALLRALNHLDAGRSGDPRMTLDTPPPDEEIQYSTDRWLSTLAEQEERAAALIVHVAQIHREFRR